MALPQLVIIEERGRCELGLRHERGHGAVEPVESRAPEVVGGTLEQREGVVEELDVVGRAALERRLDQHSVAEAVDRAHADPIEVS